MTRLDLSDIDPIDDTFIEHVLQDNVDVAKDIEMPFGVMGNKVDTLVEDVKWAAKCTLKWIAPEVCHI